MDHFPVKLATPKRGIALLTREAPKVAVIFLHGFEGDPSKTWVDFEHLIDSLDKQRQLWSEKDVFFYGYDSYKQIRPLAEEFLKFLTNVALRAEEKIVQSDHMLPSGGFAISAMPISLREARGVCPRIPFRPAEFG